MEALLNTKDKKILPVIQKPGETWQDEQKIPVPYSRINKSERLKEKLSGQILGAAIKVSNTLQQLYNMIAKAETDVNAALRGENKKLSAKGHFTWYNFDKSIKIDVNVNDTVDFDQAMIASAREKLDSFIDGEIPGTQKIVKQLINSAFHNTKGGLDSKKLMSITRFRSKIKDKRFQDACNLIEEAQQIKSSKKYYRIWVKDESGAYQNINLQFSNV